jgi:hypothetical protein
MFSEVNEDVIPIGQLARETGRSPSSLSHLARRGKLTVLPGHRVHRVIALAELAKLRPRADPRQADTPPPSAPAAAPPPSPSADATPAYAESRARRERAAAEREELALAREQRTMLPTDEVLAVVDDCAATIRTHFEALPDRLAVRLAHQDESAIRAMLADDVDRALRELSTKLLALKGPGDAT